MFSREGLSARTKRRKHCGDGAAPDALPGRSRADPDKALVMTYISRFVADGSATWTMLDNGNIELHFTTGETFLLGETGFRRLA